MRLITPGVINAPLPGSYNFLSELHPIYESVQIQFPSRLEAMALDPSKLTLRDDMIYPAGQIDVCVDVFRNVVASVNNSGEVHASAMSGRSTLVKHATLLMKSALGIEYGLEVKVNDADIPRHCGFGSSSAIIASVATAINELFGNPVTPADLVRFCAQNHGEEIDSQPKNLVPVQCIGGSAISGLFDGSLFIVAGASTPIYTGRVPDGYKVVVGVPRGYSHPDSSVLMQREIDNMDAFTRTGQEYGKDISYRILHEVLPDLLQEDWRSVKQLVFDYRWRMGSIQNCSFTYPGMIEISKELAHHEKEETTKMVSLSSVGPGFFAVTTRPDAVAKEFEGLDMNATVLNPYQGTYRVVRRGQKI